MHLIADYEDDSAKVLIEELLSEEPGSQYYFGDSEGHAEAAHEGGDERKRGGRSAPVALQQSLLRG